MITDSHTLYRLFPLLLLSPLFAMSCSLALSLCMEFDGTAWPHVRYLFLSRERNNTQFGECSRYQVARWVGR
ncbi:hypothetical protein QBC47DRAFT_23371 [Echria macrotheca]|uniref:Secreted protein n=1 Tax=Echria macrotheca TaxID=438768 RepID=A0AAJ0BN13_9PEZI|nr:hypothetical protein QBC47DRAFT_23371 [Echria macrotheca]